jgi:hypothetical protein
VAGREEEERQKESKKISQIGWIERDLERFNGRLLSADQKARLKTVSIERLTALKQQTGQAESEHAANTLIVNAICDSDEARESAEEE